MIDTHKTRRKKHPFIRQLVWIYHSTHPRLNERVTLDNKSPSPANPFEERVRSALPGPKRATTSQSPATQVFNAPRTEVSPKTSLHPFPLPLCTLHDVIWEDVCHGPGVHSLLDGDVLITNATGGFKHFGLLLQMDKANPFRSIVLELNSEFVDCTKFSATVHASSLEEFLFEKTYLAVRRYNAAFCVSREQACKNMLVAASSRTPHSWNLVFWNCESQITHAKIRPELVHRILPQSFALQLLFYGVCGAVGCVQLGAWPVSLVVYGAIGLGTMLGRSQRAFRDIDVAYRRSQLRMS